MKQKQKGKALCITLSLLFCGLFLVLPLVFVLWQAFGQGLGVWWANVSEQYTRKALDLTLLTTLLAVAVNSGFGVAAAWALTRYRYTGQKLLGALVDIPLSVSPVIAGLIFILTFGRTSPLYPWLQAQGLTIVYAVPGVILATIFVTLPYVARELIPLLNSIGTDEEEAAALMGAGGWRIFRRITWPQIKWSLLYGIVLCTARALGEFGAVSVISGHLRGKTNTLPLHIEILYNEFKYTPAFAVSSILVLLAVALLIVRSVVEKQGGKKEELR